MVLESENISIGISLPDVMMLTRHGETPHPEQTVVSCSVCQTTAARIRGRGSVFSCTGGGKVSLEWETSLKITDQFLISLGT